MPTQTGVWRVGPQLMLVFWEIVELLRDVAWLAEVGLWDGLMVHSLALVYNLP